MNSTLILASILLPFVLLVFGLSRRLERLLSKIFILAPVPALAFSFLGIEEARLHFPNILLGVSLGLDGTGRIFLFLTSLLWLFAGIQSLNLFPVVEESRRFRSFFLLAMTGNIGVTLAFDALTFYCFFTVMTLASYGLIIQTRTGAAHVAGRYFLSFAILGEMLIFSGLILAAKAGGSTSFESIKAGFGESPLSDWTYGLLFLGFGIKVGLVPLHAWLPRSYYAAPLVATAVLSGSMTKAGVLGWLRFLPFGDSAAGVWPAVFISAGIVMAFYGVAVGLLQTRARSALAFSSLSQMGYLTILLGVGLHPGSNAPLITSAIFVFSLHHGISKGVMFLLMDLMDRKSAHPYSRQLILTALGFLSLALVGIPYSSGGYAKILLKETSLSPGIWQELAGPVLVIGSVGTALLMVRFFLLCWRQTPSPRESRVVWVPSVAGGILCLAGAWLIPLGLSPLLVLDLPRPTGMNYFNAFWPTLAGLIPLLYITKSIWNLQSEHTPRPLDTLLNWIDHTFATELPRQLNDLGQTLSRKTQRFIFGLHLGPRLKGFIAWTRFLNTDWRMGMAIFLSVWAVVWLLIGGIHYGF